MTHGITQLQLHTKEELSEEKNQRFLDHQLIMIHKELKITKILHLKNQESTLSLKV